MAGICSVRRKRGKSDQLVRFLFKECATGVTQSSDWTFWKSSSIVRSETKTGWSILKESSMFILAERNDAIGTLIFNQPAKRNALSAALVEELITALDSFQKVGIRVVVLRAA